LSTVVGTRAGSPHWASAGFMTTWRGKLDWLVRNLPVEGIGAEVAKIGQRLRTDVVTVGLDEPVAAARGRVAHSAHGFTLVLTSDGSLLGRLRGAALDRAGPSAAVAEVMEAGPSTLRPHEPAIDTYEDTDTVQALIVGRDITGHNAFVTVAPGHH